MPVIKALGGHALQDARQRHPNGLSDQRPRPGVHKRVPRVGTPQSLVVKKALSLDSGMAYSHRLLVISAAIGQQDTPILPASAVRRK